MKFLDEEILQAQRQMAMQKERDYSAESLEKELRESIFNGRIHIYDQPVDFTVHEVEELKLRIVMPELFNLVEDEFRKMLYPMGNAPSHVFASDQVIFHMALSKSPSKIPNDGIPQFLPMAKKIMDAMGPKSRIIGSEVVKKEDWNFAILEFVSAALDTNVYNVMFYFSIDDQLMIGTINFPTEYQKRLVKVAKEIISSIELIEQEEA